MKPLLSAATIKSVSALKVKKYRQKYRKFTAEGEKIAIELLEDPGLVRVDAVYGLADWIDRHAGLLHRSGRPFSVVQPHELDRLSGLQTPNKVLLVLEMPEHAPPMLPSTGWMFYLDGIQDPGNLGAIWRIADWFGMPALLCSPDTADPWNPKCIQASMGAFIRVPMVVMAPDGLRERFPGWPVFGASMQGQAIQSLHFPEKGLMMIGQEGRGLSAEVLDLVRHTVSIPRGVGGGAESLNAAVAAGILAARLTVFSASESGPDSP
jgi:TrmH family RNA methyltransferase